MGSDIDSAMSSNPRRPHNDNVCFIIVIFSINIINNQLFI